MIRREGVKKKYWIEQFSNFSFTLKKSYFVELGIVLSHSFDKHIGLRMYKTEVGMKKRSRGRIRATSIVIYDFEKSTKNEKNC